MVSSCAVKDSCSYNILFQDGDTYASSLTKAVELGEMKFQCWNI